jgi:hypothetical protein
VKGGGSREGDGLADRARQTARFARQHEEIVELSKALVQTLDTRALAQDPGAARRALATFAGRLRVHAAMEQEALYPRLLASESPHVAAKAQELLDEIGPIYQAFFAFLARWSESARIQADPETFCRETTAELHRLARRLRRENEELYPMVDALDRADGVTPPDKPGPP